MAPYQALEAETTVERWGKLELVFQSTEKYENPLYDLKIFRVLFQSPTGRSQRINGFWDGNSLWKVRFQPDELGLWSYQSECSNEADSGLHCQVGTFKVTTNNRSHAIYAKGSVIRPEGRYYLTHYDGTPFFWTADTAWNGALKSTDDEWRFYLQDRFEKGFNVIQFVTTQWRGGDADRNGEIAFTGSGRIRINPEFFRRLDAKVDLINEYGLIAAPVLLWTLQWGQGRHLSPGYYLPEDEAVLLARYMVARYGGNHIAWILGGDGGYVGEYEQRWKSIGRRVFEDDPPGIVAQHPHGLSGIGSAYRDEVWLDIFGYQSSHSKKEETVNWINKGPVSREWDQLPAKPIINLEPIYEEIHTDVTAEDVRNACYWSVFAAPPAGITYGANGIWPWLREGQKILNHSDAPWTSDWRKSLSLPGSQQVGYLSWFIQQLPWWKLKPAHMELLTEQPGDKIFNRFVPVLRTDDYRTILAYIPTGMEITIR
ncbi:MAG: apiosidase-like domain-containing protein, partial [bacterium]